VAGVAISSLVAPYIALIVRSLFASVRVVRKGKPLSLTPAFDSYIQTTFGALARDAARQLLTFGLAVAIVAPPRKKRSRGVRAVERPTAAAGSLGVAGPTDTMGSPVVLPLDDPELIVSVEMEDGIRYYTVERDGIAPAVLKDAMGRAQKLRVHGHSRGAAQ
jgi:hypothetical protein